MVAALAVIAWFVFRPAPHVERQPPPDDTAGSYDEDDDPGPLEESRDKKEMLATCMAKNRGIDDGQRKSLCGCFVERTPKGALSSARDDDPKTRRGFALCARSLKVRAYPDFVKPEFVAGCAENRGGSPEETRVCNCAFDRIAQAVPYYDFLDAQADLVDGESPPAFFQTALAACE